MQGDYLFPKRVTDIRCPRFETVNGRSERCSGFLMEFRGHTIYTCERCGENAWRV